jgi:hypothetical protein
VSEQRVGSCSLCGGDVIGHRGAWMAVGPPPPDSCRACGAKRSDDVIPMRRPSRLEGDGLSERFRRYRDSTANLEGVVSGVRCGCNAGGWCDKHRPAIFASGCHA